MDLCSRSPPEMTDLNLSKSLLCQVSAAWFFGGWVPLRNPSCSNEITGLLYPRPNADWPRLNSPTFETRPLFRVNAFPLNKVCSGRSEHLQVPRVDIYGG